MPADCPDLERFVRGETDPAHFPHREHLRMAFEMLRRHDFAETALHYSRGLRALTARAGKPEAFHQTVTIAFLALIAERMARGQADDFAAFAREPGPAREVGARPLVWARAARLRGGAADVPVAGSCAAAAVAALEAASAGRWPSCA